MADELRDHFREQDVGIQLVSLTELLNRQLRALRSDPTSTPVAEELRTLAHKLGAYEAYAQAFADRGEHLCAQQRIQEALDSWFESAQVFEDHLQDHARAAQVYRRVLRAYPNQPRALVSLGLALYDMQRWDELITLYRHRLDKVSDEMERLTLQQYIAELLADKKSDPNGALDVLIRAAGQAPHDLRILGRLEQLGEGTGRLSEVAVVMGNMGIHQSDPKLRAAISLRLGEMHLGLIDNPNRALVYLRSALVDEGKDPYQLGSIEDFFRNRTKFDGLGEVWDQAVAGHSYGSHRINLERELARYFELEINQPELALRTIIRALRSGAQDRNMVEDLVRLGRRLEVLPEVAQVLEHHGNSDKHPLLASFMRRQAGAIYSELRRADGAPPTESQKRYDEKPYVLFVDGKSPPEFLAEDQCPDPPENAASRGGSSPSDFVPASGLLRTKEPQSLETMTLLSSEATSVEPLVVEDADIADVKRVEHRPEGGGASSPSDVEALEHSLTALEGEPRAQRCAEVASAWRSLGEDERAELVLRQGLKLRAHDRTLLAHLSSLLWEKQSWRDWLDVADRQLDAEPEHSLALRLQMADVAQQHLQDIHLSKRLAEEAAGLHPTESKPLEVLEALARANHDLPSLAYVLRRRLSLSPDDVHHSLSLGDVLYELGDLAGAQRVLLVAHRQYPYTHEILRKLADVQLALGDHDRAEQSYQQLIAQGPAPIQAYAWAQLASMWLKLERMDEVGIATERARKLDPYCIRALAISVELAEIRGNLRKASRLAEECTKLVSSSQDIATWLRKAAQLSDGETKDVARARQLYQRALELDPDDPHSEARLGELLLEQGEVVAARTHLLKAAHEVRDEQRAAVLFFRAALAAEDLGLLPDALRGYVCALERIPLYKDALMGAGHMANELGRYPAAYDYGAQLLLHFEQELSASERSDAYRWMANAKRDEGDGVAAVRLAQQAHVEQPDDIRILRLLADTLVSADQRADAVEILQLLAEREPLASEKIRSLLRATSLLSHSTEDRGRRASMLEVALEKDPSDKRVALSLARARAAIGDMPGQVAALEHAARLAPRKDRAELQTQVSDLLRLSDRPAAMEALKAALDAVPDYAPAVDRLQVMLATDGQQEARIEVLIRAAEAAREDEPRLSEQWRSLAAQLAEIHLRQPNVALSALGTDNISGVVARDLLFRSAMEGGSTMQQARRLWGEQCVAHPGDRRAFSRLADLHYRAGDMPAARFVWELSGVLFGEGLPPDAPPPQALPAILSSTRDTNEADRLEDELFHHLGYVPLRVARAALSRRRPRRRDVALMRSMRQELARSLREVVESFSIPLPPVYWVTTQESPVAPGWAFGEPCLLVHGSYHVDAVSPPLEIDEVNIRFYIGRALALLRPQFLSLHLLPTQTLRAMAYGLADIPLADGDPVTNQEARRKGRAVARLLEPDARITASACAYAWLNIPHTSFYEVRLRTLRTANQWGLLGCGSPAAATQIVSERSSVDRAQLLRFAVFASGSLAL